MTFGRITVLLGAIFAVILALLFAFPEMRWILPIAAAREAEGIDSLFLLMLVVSTGIFIFVQGFLLYFVWLYRRRPDEDEDAVGRALHGDNRLEIAWTAAPALFLVVLTILSYREFEKLRLEQTVEDARIVQVEGYQFAWNFIHPAEGIQETNVLTLQKDVPVTLEITSRDVNHAFWVPAFRIKQDATAGFLRRVNLTPTLSGEFPLRCAELCGAGHSGMIANVRVLEADEYATWQEEALANSAPAANASPEELVAYGVQLYQANGCIGCHQLEEAGATAQIGPDHNQMGAVAEQRVEDPTYPGQATTPAEYIAESIRHPGDYIVEGYPPNVMPAYPPDQISDEDLNAIVQMLLLQQ